MKPLVTVIRYSCLTGKAVWVYRGPSRSAARVAYFRACRAEYDRVRRFPSQVAGRKANIRRFLAAVTASHSLDRNLSPEQRDAARRLAAIADAPVKDDREFYNHVVESRRRLNAKRNRNDNHSKQST